MGDYAIEVSGLGKRYKIGPPVTAGRKIRAALRRQPFRRTNVRRMLARIMPERFPPRPAVPPPQLAARTDFWALRDVSFKLKRGEVLGVVGRNGAGKSTLLKILSRITAPTEGQALIRGRVGSLLEVGTGFHPNLSGRENIYINGVTLGLSHAEIKRRFQEIVDFAEIERFIDTPVKHYSSGMYARLAFAVAAHLTADVLLVDEVLGVGDAAFQKKCLGKLDDLTAYGRTVLFVSHSPGAIQRHCANTLWLDQGRVRAIGPTAEVLAAYLEMDAEPTGVYEVDFPPHEESKMQLTRARLEPPAGRTFELSKSLRFEFEVLTREALPEAYVAMGIRNALDQVVYWTADIDSPRFRHPRPGVVRLTCEVPPGLLVPGRYSANFGIVMVGRGRIFAMLERRLSFEIEDRESFLASHGVAYPGNCAIPSKWSVSSPVDEEREHSHSEEGQEIEA